MQDDKTTIIYASHQTQLLIIMVPQEYVHYKHNKIFFDKGHWKTNFMR